LVYVKNIRIAYISLIPLAYLMSNEFQAPIVNEMGLIGTVNVKIGCVD